MHTWNARKGKKSVTKEFGSKPTAKAVPFAKQGLKVRRGKIRGASYEQATGEEPVDYRVDNRFGSRHRRGR